VRFVPPDELSSVWGFVEHGLNEVLALTKEPWAPSQVEYHLREKLASLFICEDGFCVLQTRKADWTSRPYVNVWVMWFRPEAAQEKMHELVAFLDEVTKQAKCDWWEWSSPRKGWRWMERLGLCEQVRTIWRRK
jgi:hypothetical protein